MSLENLERDFHQHLQDDRNHHEKIATILAEIRVTLKEIEKDVHRLNEKVLIGNGTDSVMSRLKGIEHFIDEQEKKIESEKSDSRWGIGIVVAGINSFAALGALCISIYVFFSK